MSRKPNKLKLPKSWHSITVVILGTTLLLGLAKTWLTPVQGQIEQTYLVESTPENIIWGELFKPDSEPILRVPSGARVTKQDALLLGSAAVDFEVSQVVDIVKGIHGVIDKELLADLKLEPEEEVTTPEDVLP